MPRRHLSSTRAQGAQPLVPVPAPLRLLLPQTLASGTSKTPQTLLRVKTHGMVKLQQDKMGAFQPRTFKPSPLGPTFMFDTSTKEILSQRVSYLCSVPVSREVGSPNCASQLKKIPEVLSSLFESLKGC